MDTQSLEDIRTSNSDAANLSVGVDVKESGETTDSRSLRSAAMLAASASAILAACGGGDDSTTDTADGGEDGLLASNRPLSAYFTPRTDQEAARFLQQAQFTSTQEEIAALRKTTFVKWLNAQFNENTLPIGPTLVDIMIGWDIHRDITLQYQYYDLPFMNAHWYRLIDNRFKDQMRQRMALALSEFFVFKVDDVGYYSMPFTAAKHMDILSSGAFSTFDKLLSKITLSYPMGKFLSMLDSRKADGTGQNPDENYAREIMQLFTIGLYKLNINGTPYIDTSSNNPIPTYKQEDITNLARIFTGYIAAKEFHQSIADRDVTFITAPMAKDPSGHDFGPVTFLGQTITGSNMSLRLNQALAILFNHPNVGPFFCRQMIQRLVTSNPSPEYVARVASVFNDNGYGVRGDLKAVWSAILLDYEARAMPTADDKSFGKLREPMVRFVQWARTCDFTSKLGTWKLDAREIGQSPLKAQSVFNFFRPEYSPPKTSIASTVDPANTRDPAKPYNPQTPNADLRKRLCAPEFQISNEIGVMKYVNFMTQAIYRAVPCYDPTSHFFGESGYGYHDDDLHARYTKQIAKATDATTLANHLNLVFAAGQISPTRLQIVIDALKISNTSSAAEKLDQIRAAVLMVMNYPEYLVQK